MRLWWHCLVLAHLTGSQARSQDCTAHPDLRSTALLYAHRCNVRDVPIPVPVPANVIPDLIIPSHIVIPRCQGEISVMWRGNGDG